MTSSYRPGARSGRRRSRRSPRPGSPSCAAVAGRVSRCFRREASCGHPGSRSLPARSTSRTPLLIAAQLGEAGATATVFASVADDAAATRAALEQALEHDVLVTSGGVSVGPARPRARDPRRARCAGGLLAGRREARQADRLRRARRVARLRPAGEPRLVARRVRAVRPAGAARAARRARARAGRICRDG